MEHVFLSIEYNTLFLPEIAKGRGCYLFDKQNREYLDMESGIWCVSLGHCHPRINEAMKIQLDKIIHTGYCYSHPIVEEAAKEILEITEFPDGKCVFLNSGSEAVEFGIQVLRKITEKTKILTLSNSFLGSYSSLGNRKDEEWQHFDWNGCVTCSHAEKCNLQCNKLSDIPFETIGGFVFEPGSSSGIRFPPDSVIRNIVQLIKQNGGFIHVNEVTTGIGRTGKWFGYQHYGISPDMVSMGKGLGNGYPVSAVAMSSNVVSILSKKAFHYLQSHQNNPLGCATAKEVITIIKQEKIIEKARETGKYFISQLLQLHKKYLIIKEVRGRGLMVIIEFSESINDERISSIYHQCQQRGFLFSRGLKTFRFDPPLIITKEEIDSFLENFEEVLDHDRT